MGFKSVELQVAIPRSQDAGKMQEQAMRQGQQFQETLTQQQLREQVVNRTKVNEYDEVYKRDISDDKKEDSQEQAEHENKKKQNQEKTNAIEHPYLGQRIDFSG